MVFMGRGLLRIPLPEGKRQACLLCGCMQASLKKCYIETLPPVASDRYRKRLDLVGLRKWPYELADQEWEDDVTKWPGVEFQDIVLYLTGTPGWQGTRCKHLKLDEGWKNSRISRTTQRIDTRPVLSCLQGPVQSSDINIVGLVLTQVSPHLKVYRPIIDGPKVLDI